MIVCDWVNETCSRELWVLSWQSKVGCKCQSICQLHNWIICSKQAPSVCHIQQRSIKETSSCVPGTNYLKQWMHNSPHNSTNSWQLFWTSAYCVSIKCSYVCLTGRLEGGGELCRRRRKAFHWILPQTVPLPAPELLLTSDSSAPTLTQWLLLPLTCTHFLITREMFMLHVSSSELGAFADGPTPPLPHWNYILKGTGSKWERGRMQLSSQVGYWLLKVSRVWILSWIIACSVYWILMLFLWQELINR